MKSSKHRYVNGINTWDNEHCDLLINKIGPDEDDGIVAKQMYVTMGDTWVITTDAEGGITLEQMTTEQASKRVRSQLRGPVWQLESRPDETIIRLYRLDPERVPND